MTFSNSILKKISTNDIKKPDSPQVIIENPFDGDIFVNGIELILSPEFSKKGKLIIEINDITEFDAKDSKQFERYTKYPIPLAKKFRAGHEIKIFAWNGTDTNTIKMSLNTSLSKESQPFNSQAVPMNITDLNNVVSGIDDIFTQQNYEDETQTSLIDMEGFKKLVLIIGGSNVATPTVLIGESNIADADLGTFMSASNPLSKTVIGSVDFGSIASRVPTAKVGYVTSDDYDTIAYLEVSDDNSSWVEVDSQSIGSTSDVTMTGSEQSYRYSRVQFLAVPSGDPSGQTVRIYEIYDSNALGGSAVISFEVLLGDSTWVELISATDIGTITEGNSLTKTIGDVINDGTNKFNYSLPSTQNRFRIKMIITGTLNIGLSVMKVS